MYRLYEQSHIVWDTVVVLRVVIKVVIGVLIGAFVADCEGVGTVGFCVMACDGGELHPDTKSRKITKRPKIGRSCI